MKGSEFYEKKIRERWGAATAAVNAAKDSDDPKVYKKHVQVAAAEWIIDNPDDPAVGLIAAIARAARAETVDQAAYEGRPPKTKQQGETDES